jgi:acyl-CoA thioester hydrolase
MSDNNNETFVSETTFHVRYAETDAMGIVHHASYIVYFEEGRSAYTRAQGRSYAEMETDGYYLAVADVQARYKRAMRYGQSVTVRCWVKEVKSRTMTFAYEVLNADTREVCVTGETHHICLTHDGRVSRFPENWLK